MFKSSVISQFLLGQALLCALVLGSPAKFDRRTTWPTETGTMVRILRSDPSLEFGSEGIEDATEDAWHVQGKRGPHDYIMKRNILLRTSRSSNDFDSDNEMSKRSGKRDSSARVLFRTSRSSPKCLTARDLAKFLGYPEA